MTSTLIAVVASVPLLFQPVIGRLCSAPNVMTSTDACFVLTDSGFPAPFAGDLMNSEAIDFAAGAYQRTTWIDQNTMLTFEEKLANGTTTCDFWFDEDTSTEIVVNCEPLN